MVNLTDTQESCDIDDLSASKTRKVLSWGLVLIIVAIFLPSIPFKFSGAPETKHIFGTIGLWLSGFLGEGIGGAFSAIGAYLIGSLELITSIAVSYTHLTLPTILLV